MNVLHSPTAFRRDDARPAELIGGHASGKLVLREVGMIFRDSAPKRKDAA